MGCTYKRSEKTSRIRLADCDLSYPLRLQTPKRKGPQLALEPLNGRGIAGYVPKP
jgi:hypothetical protein